MRSLLVLTALLLAVTAGVWWKTHRSDSAPEEPTSAAVGVSVFGAASPTATTDSPAPPRSASAPATPEPPPEAGGGDPREPQVAAGELAAEEAAAAREAATREAAARLDGGGREVGAAAEAAATSPTDAPAPNVVRHRVGEGETLYRIVLRAYGSAPQELIDRVARANGLDDPSRIAVGQELILPSIPGWPAPKHP